MTGQFIVIGQDFVSVCLSQLVALSEAPVDTGGSLTCFDLKVSDEGDLGELAYNGSVSDAGAAAEAVASIFAAELGIASVGLDDNFFDLGGDSLMAENLVLSVQKRFDVGMQTAILLEAPTPRELARLVRATSTASRRLIVPVVGSRGTEPLAMVHGVSGSPLFANRFGEKLKRHYRLLAVRGMGIESGEEPYETREEMFGGYFESLKATTGRTPLVIGGICMGGIIAMELGRLAHEATGMRPRLVLIDPPPLGSYWMRPDPDNSMNAHRRRRLDYHVLYWRTIHGTCERLGLGLTRLARVARHKLFKKTLTRALAGFTPARYPCDMLVIASSEWGGDTVGQFREWASGNGRLHTVVFPGTHDGFREANMDAIDSEIIRFLDEHSADGDTPADS